MSGPRDRLELVLGLLHDFSAIWAVLGLASALQGGGALDWAIFAFFAAYYVWSSWFLRRGPFKPVDVEMLIRERGRE